MAIRSVLITGGASGLGRCFAKELHKLFSKVAVLDINQDFLNTFKAEHPDIMALSCDVSNSNQVEQQLDQLEETWGIPNVLINNAGLIYNRPLYNPLDKEQRKHSIEAWQEVIDVNLTGTFNVTSHWVEKMVKNRKKGVVINISSICANGNAGQSAYSASKAGVEALSKTWAKELGRFGIRSVAIAPGYTDSEGTVSNLSPNMIDVLKKQTSLGRLGLAKDVLGGIVFAIENDFVTGTVVHLDGGLRL